MALWPIKGAGPLLNNAALSDISSCPGQYTVTLYIEPDQRWASERVLLSTTGFVPMSTYRQYTLRLCKSGLATACEDIAGSGIVEQTAI